MVTSQEERGRGKRRKVRKRKIKPPETSARLLAAWLVIKETFSEIEEMTMRVVMEAARREGEGRD